MKAQTITAKRRKDSNHGPVAVAAIAASLLMLAFGITYRVLAAPAKKMPLNPNVLDGFPMQIGDWTGEEVPIYPAIKDAIDADAYVRRRYSRRNGLESISLYLPCGVDASTLLQHIPENCYVGAGWTFVARHPAELLLNDERRLACSILQFARSGLDTRKLTLLHFLVADGEYFTTFSAVAQAKGWRHFGGVNYAAQVQIMTSADNLAVDAATRVVMNFARDAIPAIDRIFADLKSASDADEPCDLLEGK